MADEEGAASKKRVRSAEQVAARKLKKQRKKAAKANGAAEPASPPAAVATAPPAAAQPSPDDAGGTVAAAPAVKPKRVRNRSEEEVAARKQKKLNKKLAKQANAAAQLKGAAPPPPNFAPRQTPEQPQGAAPADDAAPAEGLEAEVKLLRRLLREKEEALAAGRQVTKFAFGFEGGDTAEAAGPDEDDAGAESDREGSEQGQGGSEGAGEGWAWGNAAGSERKAADFKARPREGAQDPRKVYVGGMPFTYDEDAVRAVWGECGAVSDVDMVTFPDSGRFRGIAMVTFEDEEGAKKALEYDGTGLDGGTLVVRPYVPSGRQRGNRNDGAPTQGPEKTPGYLVAYVGNLPTGEGAVSDGDLQRHFRGLTLRKVRLHRDEAGACRGFAHLHFKSEAGLDRAVKDLNGTELLGRKLRVTYARPPRDRGDPV
ncbi:unnamed protein product [Pedinophyceae sp. YPF-701]|nr:unnamed protein product [Pedinophyceae sp. YPF-701]